MSILIENPTTPIVEVRPKTVPEVLRHAALIIEERGWIQDGLKDEVGRVCARGALYTASEGYCDPFDDKPSDQPLTIQAEVALQRIVGRRVPDWNDEVGRTAAEVTTALRAAADAAERDG